MLDNCFYPKDITKKYQNHVDDGKIDNLFKFSRNVIFHNSVIGSSYVEIGDSKIVCIVFAPRFSSKNQTGQNVNNDFGLFECNVTYSQHIRSKYQENEYEKIEKNLAQNIKNSFESNIFLEKYPKAIISTQAIILKSSSNDFSAMINGLSLALSDSGVQMKDILTSVTIGFPDKSKQENSQFQINPLLSIAYASSNDDILFIDYTGNIEDSKFIQIFDIAKQECSRIRNSIKNVLAK